MKHPLVRLAVFLVLIVVSACSDRGSAPTELITLPDPLLAHLWAAGFDTTGAVEDGEHIVVEGDIAIKKQSIYGLPVVRGSYSGPLFQYHSTNVVAQMNTWRIRVDLDSIQSASGLLIAVTNAMSAWLSTGSGIMFEAQQPDDTIPADIRVVFRSLPSGTVARGEYPSGGKPGALLMFTNGSIPGPTLTPTQLKWVLVHELGHNIGLRHTNWGLDAPSTTGAHHIPGTPSGTGNTADPASVMNGGAAGTTPNGFSANDLTAVRYLYPQVYAVWMSDIPILLAHEPPYGLYYLALKQNGQVIPGKVAQFYPNPNPWLATINASGVVGLQAGTGEAVVLVDAVPARRPLEFIEVTVSGPDTVAATDSATFSASIWGWRGPYQPSHWVAKTVSGVDVEVCQGQLTCTISAADITLGGVRFHGVTWPQPKFRPVTIVP